MRLALFCVVAAPLCRDLPTVVLGLVLGLGVARPASMLAHVHIGGVRDDDDDGVGGWLRTRDAPHSLREQVLRSRRMAVCLALCFGAPASSRWLLWLGY